MAGESVSTLVIFIAALTVAAGVAGTLAVTVTDITASVDQQSAALSDRIDTDVEIISDPGSAAVYDDANGSVTVLVKNTGDRTVPANRSVVDVLLDGQFVPATATNLTVLSAAEWTDGTVARLRIDRTLTTGTHRVTVAVGGERETFEFYHD